MWPVLLQCKLVGKAQEVVSALSLEDSLQYDVLKEAILRAYELVPEAYRQKFWSHRKSAGQTFVEFAREKGNLFDKWSAANGIRNDFELLRQLVLLEDFKGSLPEKVVMFLNEQKVSTLSRAAVLADEFVLTHKNVFSSPLRSDRFSASRATSAEPSLPPLEKARGPPLSQPGSRECGYCHKRGHVIADCLSLKRKQQAPAAAQQRNVCLVKRVRKRTTERANARSDKPNPCFTPFASKGFVSLSAGMTDRKEITLLRDSAGSQLIIKANILPLSSATSCHSSVKIRGVGMVNMLVPLHRIHLQCPLLSGWFEVAVLPDLPVPGVDFLLCNDIAGGQVSPTPIVVDVPVVINASSENQESPEVFPACAVTRAQAKEYGEDLADVFFFTDRPTSSEATESQIGHQHAASLSTKAMELPATREEFIKAQQNDETLQNCLSSVLGVEQEKGQKVVYFMDRGLLVRCWRQDASGDGDWSTAYQVVVPTAYRPQVLSLAHDNLWAGHLGITKTYDKILRHFFWPGLKADVVRHCRPCHVCQVTGKPNQVVPPAPLCPIPMMGEPFERVMVDCVGPLPKTKSGNQFLLTIMCASTRFPEAIPLRRVTAPVISKALVKFFTVFGLPTVVQTDQGTNFMSRVFAQVLKSLGIKHITSSPYHPESQGALERFHQTMKTMLKKCCFESQKDWDDAVPFVLFAAREAVQESLGFSPGMKSVVP
uniref:Gypsy retrotransposon integrase-like protein 1 n=1 Tax=Takifugu rubripes TaxID=31033 RepID=A0A674N472_TAKRU